MAVVAIGLNYTSAPLGLLERLALGAADLPKALAGLCALDPIQEAVILSTCNRVETYVGAQRYHPAVRTVRRFLSEVSGVAEEEIAVSSYAHYDTSAVRHLFRVASGLDSMVIGESEILGQVREAYTIAREEGTARRGLGTVFERALRVGKRARSETGIARHAGSIPAAAARLASEIAGGLGGKSVAVVGAGRIAQAVAAALLRAAPQRIVVVNRTPERARRLARAVGGEGAGLDALPSVLREAHVVVFATSSSQLLLGRAGLAHALDDRAEHLVLLDLSVPRDVDPSARELHGVTLRDIDDLRSGLERAGRERDREVPAVDAIVDEEIDRFCTWRGARAAAPSISALREWADELRAGEVQKAARKMSLDADGVRALDALTRSIVNKLLHSPVVKIKDLAQTPDGRLHLETFQELFDLDGQ